MGARDPGVKSNFRESLTVAMNSASEDPCMVELWCPVVHAWIDPDAMTAAHMYPYCNGQNSMHGIFGLLDRNELNAVENGMMILSRV